MQFLQGSSCCSASSAIVEFPSLPWRTCRLRRNFAAASCHFFVSTPVVYQQRFGYAAEVVSRGRIEAVIVRGPSSSSPSLPDEKTIVQKEKDAVKSFPVREQPANGSAISSIRPVESGKRKSVMDYMDSCADLIKPDGGPPRWFTPLGSGPPYANAPLLLFLPGMDGTGYGLVVHHQALERIFEIQCLHIPVMDRTPLEGLLKLVEDTLTSESKVRSQPIYIVGDSFGGALALALAARNPDLDLILVVANPATSFEQSPLQVYLPLLEVVPSEALSALPFLISFTIGDPIRMALARVDQKAAPLDYIQQLATSLLELLPTLPTLGKVVPKETLLWKLDLLRTAGRYANSRLHAITAQVLVLASGKDQLLPSVEEGLRLEKILPNCVMRTFPDSGHTLLLEDGPNLATLIKKSCLYRVSRDKVDYVGNYTSPTLEEVQIEYDRAAGVLRQLLSPIYLSTTDDGTIVRGLPRISNDRAVIYVGNHSLLGLDLGLFMGEFAVQRGQILRGLAHPMFFQQRRSSDPEASVPTYDQARLFGAAPASPRTLYKFLQSGSSVLLYPGGTREAIHRKGETHKLFWPEQQEFVRMAAKFGAIIVPFGVVGEDDALELVFDLDDMMNIPLLKSQIDNYQKMIPEARPNASPGLSQQGEAAIHMPIAAPKIPPGRLYTLFGKPIDTRDKPELLTNKEHAESTYKQIKGQVQAAIDYLLEKRKEDPYRDFMPRILYETLDGGKQAPGFDLG